MGPTLKRWLASISPFPRPPSPLEQWRGAVCVFAGLLLTAALLMLGRNPAQLYLIAPLGASAVLLFCLPASPLAQPWPVVAGNTVSALIGIACARWLGPAELALPAAGALAVLAMFALRCLHPPGAAIALMCAAGGPKVQALGFLFALLPVGASSVLIVIAALLVNRLAGRRYPHFPQSAQRNTHATADLAPTARLGFTEEDLDAALARYGQMLDVSRDDLEDIILFTEQHAYARRLGAATCGKAMSRDVVTLAPATPVTEAWTLMRRHRVHALPVLDADRRVAGIVTQGDLLVHAGAAAYGSLAARMRHLLWPVRRRAEVGALMHREVRCVGIDMPVVELVPLMANTGLHHFPVVEADGVFAGMLTQSDLIAALYESGLAPRPGARPADRGPTDRGPVDLSPA